MKHHDAFCQDEHDNKFRRAQRRDRKRRLAVEQDGHKHEPRGKRAVRIERGRVEWLDDVE